MKTKVLRHAKCYSLHGSLANWRKTSHNRTAHGSDSKMEGPLETLSGLTLAEYFLTQINGDCQIPPLANRNDVPYKGT